MHILERPSALSEREATIYVFKPRGVFPGWPWRLWGLDIFFILYNVEVCSSDRLLDTA